MSNRPDEHKVADAADQAYEEFKIHLANAWRGPNACSDQKPAPSVQDASAAADAAYAELVQYLSNAWKEPTR
jgi:hypothetical protein